MKSAELTRKINDVRVSEKSSEAISASEGQRLGVSSTLLTGRGSRAELTFQDRTVTRIGANSVFRFSSGSRDMEIGQGSFLLQVPKNAGGATIRTSTVTAAITGTTTMMEFSPGVLIKFVTFEGKAKLKNKKGKTVEVPAGEMLVMHPDAEDFPPTVVINIKKMMKSSKLTDKKTFGNLDDEAEQLIDDTVARQLAQRRNGELLPGGIIVQGPGVRSKNGINQDIRTILPGSSDKRSESPDEGGGNGNGGGSGTGNGNGGGGR
ncbi:MAG: FecR domain-containing protein [Armatimonadetes bacterium]|nr:FecR domain-containing protein [Akkermansiaceae bacterium]